MPGILDDLMTTAELDHATAGEDLKSPPAAASATTPPPGPAADEGDGIAEVFRYPMMKR